MEHVGDGDTSSSWCTWNYTQMIGKRTGRFGKKSTSTEDSDYSVIKIGYNTQKSPRYLTWLVIA